jgi:hypothetical protein
MSSHHTPGVYDAEILRIMGEAFDRAWSGVKPSPKNAEASRFLMARAIIQAVDAGAAEATILADKATRALSAAIGEDREALVLIGARRLSKKGPPLAYVLTRSASPLSANAA